MHSSGGRLIAGALAVVLLGSGTLIGAFYAITKEQRSHTKMLTQNEAIYYHQVDSETEKQGETASSRDVLGYGTRQQTEPFYYSDVSSEYGYVKYYEDEIVKVFVDNRQGKSLAELEEIWGGDSYPLYYQIQSMLFGLRDYYQEGTGLTGQTLILVNMDSNSEEDYYWYGMAECESGLNLLIMCEPFTLRICSFGWGEWREIWYLDSYSQCKALTEAFPALFLQAELSTGELVSNKFFNTDDIRS